MVDIQEEYKRWSEQENMPAGLKKELTDMSGDREKIHEAFYRELEFGTAGLRGIMGAGTNRMNIFIIRKVTQGMADYMKEKFGSPSIAISYDSRNDSRTFAENTASVMCANGIRTYIYKQLMPVSALSFAVRKLRCSMGVMITASHNPKEYNGYKVYNSRGCQILGSDPGDILEHIGKVDIFDDVRYISFDRAMQNGCEYISETIEQAYIDRCFSCGTDSVDLHDLTAVYSPLNGAGNLPVRAVLGRAGLKNLYTVPEQQNPDGDFPTCPYPNPENRDIYELGRKLCEEVHGDIILATDPDCDRVGMSLPVEGKYVYPRGNHIGVLLFDYLCRMRKMPDDPVMIRTIVSTPLVDRIAASYGVSVQTTLIGFKYIGEKIDELGDRYVFGFEEGNGYLAGDHVRDKDGVSTALLVCQMAAFHKARGKNLLEVLEEISDQYGYYREKVLNFTFEGSAGAEKMKKIMDHIRKDCRRDIFGGKKLAEITDYMHDDTGLPRENIMEFVFRDGSKLIVRPSGTEPKIKMYLFAHDDDYKMADEIINENERIADKLINE